MLALVVNVLRKFDRSCLGRSGLRISPLCFGCMNVGTEWGFGAVSQMSLQTFDFLARDDQYPYDDRIKRLAASSWTSTWTLEETSLIPLTFTREGRARNGWENTLRANDPELSSPPSSLATQVTVLPMVCDVRRRHITDDGARARRRLALMHHRIVVPEKGNPNGGGNSRKNMVESLDTSLKRMGIDAVDLYYVHVW